MSSKAVIIVEENDDGDVFVRADFEPPITDTEDVSKFPFSHQIAGAAIAFINSMFPFEGEAENQELQ